MLCILNLNLIMHSTMFWCLRWAQDQNPDSTALFEILCFLTHYIDFAISRFVFRTKRFSFLHHQVSSPSADYLVLCRVAKRIAFVLPVNENHTFQKSFMLCILNWNLKMHSTMFWCLRWVQDHIQDSSPLLKIFCILTQSIKFAVSRFVFRTKWFSFLHHQVSLPSAGDLVRWRDGERKSFCFPSKPEQHILKVFYVVHTDLKLDYAFNHVLMSTLGTRPFSRLIPIA